MILKKIKAFLKTKGITGFYFGRSLKTVAEGSLVLFPYDPAVLNCGITGVLAFKRRSAQTVNLPVQKIEHKVETLFEYTWERLEKKRPGRIDSYLGGKDLLKEIKHLCNRFKAHDEFYEVFSNRGYREQLSNLCAKLESLIEAEDNVRIQKKGRLAAEEYESMSRRIIQLRDILWSLKYEILENIDKINALGSFGQYDNTPLAVRRLKEINLVFNNLDRLEVRGRDSAGISLLFVLDEANFSRFQKTLQEKSLLDEFEARQAGYVLLNRGIRINKHSPTVSLAFTYKIAAEIGSLGDNVQYLRKQVREDAIFQHLIRFPHIDHSAVAHTRWASVGEISEANCHPVDNFGVAQDGFHEKDGVGVCEPNLTGIIHVCLNGDIDNYQSLKRDYERESGRAIAKEITTDTQIIPLQIEKYLKKDKTLETAFRLAVSDFEGSHAIAMHSDLAPGKIFLAQKGSGQAIFVGLAEDHYVLASESYGFVEETPRYVKLDGEKVVEGISGKTQGQIFVLDQNSSGGIEGIKAMYYDGMPIELSEEDVKETEITSRDIDRQNYPHYFLKEISESPRSVEQTIEGRVAIVEKNGKRCPQILLDASVIPARLESALRQNRIRKIFFMGQGTAGVAASGCAELLKYYLKETDIRVAALKASEFSGFMLADALEDTLVVAITQSGTTTDTNRAIDMAKGRGAYTIAIVNRRDSDITFKVDGVLYTSTGRDIEMSVASTKAYYSQVVGGSILGLRLAQLVGSITDDLIIAEIEHLWRLPACMEKVLEKRREIGQSAEKFAVTKQYWAVVGSGPNKISADEIRIKLSELCYKTISSDVVEDKKHIDLSSEPLIFVCAAGNRDDVVGDIVKDTAIFKAHQAVPIVVATEGEHRFEPYADAVIYVPEVKEHFAPILNTLAGHLWGYYAALAINEESRYLFNFREQIHEHVATSMDKGQDVYEIILDEGFKEKAARFYKAFKERISHNRYTTAMAIQAASDLTLLLKYLAGRLPVSDFEFDFGIKGTAPNILTAFFECIGKVINEMARPVDAIKHQAKTVTVGTSRISEKVEGLLFEALGNHGFNQNQLTTSNVLVLKRLQAVISEIKGTTLYRIAGLNYLGEPVEDSTIHVIKKEGSAAELVSRVETDNRLRGTKRIIVKNGNVFIGKGRTDNRSILAVPVISAGTNIDYLLLFNVGFKTQVELEDKVSALGGKYHHIRNLVEETSLAWKDEYLNLLEIEELFGISAEKISESIVNRVKNGSTS
ncbi:MAG: glutamine--fructose-6-phosphate aminotransferase [Deltaproteobacteria bacterium]|nr:MAG: glutamine--fructose-6-phosphate aminotransferase [Deltaproteobacteria bacterium]